jgi:hypothetical protein
VHSNTSGTAVYQENASVTTPTATLAVCRVCVCGGGWSGCAQCCPLQMCRRVGAGGGGCAQCCLCGWIYSGCRAWGGGGGVGGGGATPPPPRPKHTQVTPVPHPCTCPGSCPFTLTAPPSFLLSSTGVCSRPASRRGHHCQHQTQADLRGWKKTHAQAATSLASNCAGTLVYTVSLYCKTFQV